MARVLVIDDVEELREVLREALRADGHDVVVAAEGGEGLALHRRDPVDVVITDIFMPGQEGIETILELRRCFPGVKVIAMSGGGTLGSLDYLQAAEQLGADRALMKPFRYDAMLAAVRELVAG
jgi:DNA-binding response OmpR family regulator